jgi:RNA polymerase sigma factor (TIGR02999 family)
MLRSIQKTSQPKRRPRRSVEDCLYAYDTIHRGLCYNRDHLPTWLRATLMPDVTQILSRIEAGDPSATDELLPLVYEELRRLATRRLAHEKPGQTLQATALVHEAYLRLIGGEAEQHWDSRGHFFAAAAEAMRRILVENARRKGRRRHGGDRERLELEVERLAVAVTAHGDVLDVHEALDDLEQIDAQAAGVVKLHYFLGLSFAETAELLGISERSTYRNWSYARAWLFQHLAEGNS